MTKMQTKDLTDAVADLSFLFQPAPAGPLLVMTEPRDVGVCCASQVGEVTSGAAEGESPRAGTGSRSSPGTRSAALVADWPVGRSLTDKLAAILQEGAASGCRVRFPSRGTGPNHPAGRPCGAPGKADPQDAAREAERFLSVGDANQDGKLSLDEVPEDRRERLEELIAKAGGDKSITKEQFIKAFIAMRGGADPARKPEANPSPSEPVAAGSFPSSARWMPTATANFPPTRSRALPRLCSKLDRNGDGKLSGDELPTGPPGSFGGHLATCLCLGPEAAGQVSP